MTAGIVDQAYSAHIGRIRAKELPDLTSSTFLDAAASPPVPHALLNAVHADLTAGPGLANPHSQSPSGRRTRERIDRVRSIVCRDLFGVERRGGAADECNDSGWELAFSGGATASLQTVARSFDFGRSGRLAYISQSHSSLYGIRDIVTLERHQGAAGVDVLDEADVLPWLREASQREGSSLLALPLQCNATGARFHRLISSVLRARQAIESQTRQRRVFVLLDVASYLSSSSRMYLRDDDAHQPDFLCFSFLKILGYPSGLGGLMLLRQSAAALASKHYFGGGALEASTSRLMWRKPAREVHEALEDGTVNMFGIVAVEAGLASLRSPKMLGTWEQSSNHVDRLTMHLWDRLDSLRHGDGSALCEVYSHRPELLSDSNDSLHTPRLSQGPTVLFNVLQPQGDLPAEDIVYRRIDPSEVDRLACIEDIQLRSGRMCNVGAITTALQLEERDVQALWERGIGCGSAIRPTTCSDDDPVECARLQALVSGAIRVSVCAWNIEADVDRFVLFLQKHFFVTADQIATAHDDFVSCSAGDDGEGSDVASISEESSPSLPAGSSCETSVTDHAGTAALTSKALEVPFSGYRLEEIHVYPIKSCASQKITGPWKLNEAGLEHDRSFCLIEPSSGKILSQKKVPAMARIRPRVRIDTGTLDIYFVDEKGFQVHSLSVPLFDDDAFDATMSPRRQYDMCGATLYPAPLADEAVRQAFSSFLERDCTLARFPTGGHRSSDGVPLRLSNESPFLLITAESVKQICTWIGDENSDGKRSDPDRVAMAFRANFILTASDDAQPFYEDDAEQVRIGPHRFTVLGPCRRCEMIALDPVTGQRTPEVLSAVARHRRRRQGQWKGRIVFGQHLICRPPRSTTALYIMANMPVSFEPRP